MSASATQDGHKMRLKITLKPKSSSICTVMRRMLDGRKGVPSSWSAAANARSHHGLLQFEPRVLSFIWNDEDCVRVVRYKDGASWWC